MTDYISSWEPGLLGLFLFAAAVMLVMTAVMVIAAVLGEKKPNDDKLRPYESGIIPTGSARYRYPLPFFLIAVFFLLFDAGRLPLSRPPQAVAIILIIVMLVGGMYPHLLIELAIKAVLAL